MARSVAAATLPQRHTRSRPTRWNLRQRNNTLGDFSRFSGCPRKLAQKLPKEKRGPRREPLRAHGEPASSRGSSPASGRRHRYVRDVTEDGRRHWARVEMTDGCSRRSLLPVPHTQRPTAAAAAIIFSYYATVKIRIDFGAGFCLFGPLIRASSSAITSSSASSEGR